MPNSYFLVRILQGGEHNNRAFAAGHARINGEPYLLLDRSLEEVVHHIAKDLQGKIRLSWPVSKV